MAPKSDSKAGKGKGKAAAETKGESTYSEYVENPTSKALVEEVKSLMVDVPSAIEGLPPKKELSKAAAGLLTTSVVAALKWTVRATRHKNAEMCVKATARQAEARARSTERGRAL